MRPATPNDPVARFKGLQGLRLWLLRALERWCSRNRCPRCENTRFFF